MRSHIELASISVRRRENMMNRCLAMLCLALCAGFGGVARADAQSYPSKPVRVVSTFSPGGTNDLLSRLVAQKLTERFGKPVVVENRIGANGIVGTQAVAKAAPDGYTLMMGNSATHGINPSVYRKLPYDAITDFVPIVLVASNSLILVVNPALPVKSVRELVALGKANPGALSFGSSGPGSSQHLAGERLKLAAGIDMTHIAYKGGAPALADVIAGQIPLMFVDMPTGLPQAQAGKLRALAMTGAARILAAPDLPTMAEAGIPDFQVTAWYGIVAPANTPVDVVMLLNKEINSMLQAPDVQERIRQLGAEPGGGTPEQFLAFVRAEIARYAQVVKASGFKVE
jgi:tripartite-type tricarboxylate transporter receptor subunit TctC